MRENLECSRAWGRIDGPQRSSPALARQMRQALDAFLHRLVAGTVPVRLPGAVEDWAQRSEGHFHLVPELFLQVAGWTRFRFPQAELELGPGEVLLVPPRLLHAEQVRGEADGTAFCNIVVYAEAPALTCHLAHEEAPGRPGIWHLEVRHGVEVPHLQSWLGDAARLARSAGASMSPRAAVQLRALVSAAVAGVLQALEDVAAEARPEPPLVARARVRIQNQLGDHGLSVKRLAAELGCTADYLSHLFRQSAGEHLAAYINRQRMERGAHLLRESGLAGKEVAWACGFASQSYFIRNFRAHFGMTPKAWRAGHEAEARAPRAGRGAAQATEVP